MIALSTGDRTRLAKLMGLTGSSFDGEALAAARAANRFVQEHGLTWPEVFGVAQPEAGPGANRNAAQEWRETVAACLRQPGSLRSWERDFLRSLADFARISPKQRAILVQIGDRVLRRAAA